MTDNSKNDWFNVDLSQASHIINNIKRPIGVNTISNSLGPHTYDIKGPIPVPKFIVSPFSNITVKPNDDIKRLC
jgi:topoisomerase IA-like protein